MIKESKFSVIQYNKDCENIIKEVSEYFDDECLFIMNFFEIKELPFKVNINIISSKEEYDVLFKEEFGFEASKSSRGMCKKDGSINYLSIHDYKNTTHAFEEKDYEIALEGFKKSLVHEFVHFVNKIFNKENKCGFSATYLFEGIAIYLSKQKENSKIEFNFTVDDFFIKEQSNKKYDSYYLIVKYLIENYDKSVLFDLLKDKEYAEKFLKEELYVKARSFYKRFKER